jgi:serine protease Do
VATDPVGDVALFKVDAPDVKFAFVELGDSDALEVGQYVISAGNPHGLANAPVEGKHQPSISVGIVSALHRMQGTYSDAIQTDAAVNPGNSGGPLLTLDGKQVGINGRVAVRFGNRINSGVGYAIPSNQVKNFLPVMIKGGHENSTAYHGRVEGLTLAPQHTDGRGAQVARVAPGTEAERAGFKAGDLVVECQGYPIFSSARLQGVIGTYPADAKLAFAVSRDGVETKLEAVLERIQPPRQAPPNAGYLGITVQETPDGLQITTVVANSAAEAAGLKVGDILVKVGGNDVDKPEEFTAELWKFKAGEKVTLTIRRDGEEQELEAALGRRSGRP